MRILAMILACLSLSACIDAEIDMDFTDGDTMQGAIELRLSRQLYDIMGKSPDAACPGGTHELTEQSFVCRTGGSGTIDELVAHGWNEADTGEFQPAQGARFERVGDDRLLVSMDFRQMMADRPDQARPEGMAGMEDMMRAALAGHSIVFRIRARKIVETSGILSEDETTATRVIPVAVFLDENPDPGPPFVTLLELEPTCWFGFWCG